MKNPFTNLKDKSPENLFRIYDCEKKRILKGVNWFHANKNLEILYKMYKNEVIK